jgi:hypothetical protein
VSVKGQEELEDTKGVIRSRKSKDAPPNGQKKKNKSTNNDLQNITQKTKDRATRTLLAGGFFGSGGSASASSGSHAAAFGGNGFAHAHSHSHAAANAGGGNGFALAHSNSHAAAFSGLSVFYLTTSSIPSY